MKFLKKLAKIKEVHFTEILKYWWLHFGEWCWNTWNNQSKLY